MIERPTTMDLAAAAAAVLEADPPSAGGRAASVHTLLDFLAAERSLRMPAVAVIPGAMERQGEHSLWRHVLLVVHCVDARNDGGGRRAATRDPLAELTAGVRALLEGHRPGDPWTELRLASGRLLVWEDSAGRAYWQDEYRIDRIDA